MRPEMPYLAAGSVAIVGGIAREGRFPREGINSVIGTVVLVIIASATAGSRIAPLVRAIGFILLLGAVFGAVPAFQKRKK
jgi:hypothetical protein